MSGMIPKEGMGISANYDLALYICTQSQRRLRETSVWKCDSKQELLEFSI